MKIALCTELRNVEWFESRLRSLFDGDGQLAIDELWNENQLAQALRRSRYHAVVIAMPLQDRLTYWKQLLSLPEPGHGTGRRLHGSDPYMQLHAASL